MIGTSAPLFTSDQALREIHNRPGLIPVDINVDEKKLVWMDIEDTCLVESYFFRSTQQFLDKRLDPLLFSTDITLLDRDDLISDSCYPTGFIFHMGRSGSTLLSKALARVPSHLVVSEAPPHFFFWPLLQGGWRRTIVQDERNLLRFRNLTLAMGRRRREEYNAYFIKFTTYNVLFIDFIMTAFPDVLSLFLYRHPAEVLVAMLREGPGWGRLKNSDFGALVTGCTVREVQNTNEPAFYARCLRRFLTAALEASTEDLTLANYRLLGRDTLATFLATFNYQADLKDLLLMQDQFDYYSKDDTGQKRFVPDSAEKLREVTPEIEALISPSLQELFQKLGKARNNLVNRLLQGENSFSRSRCIDIP